MSILYNTHAIYFDNNFPFITRNFIISFQQPKYLANAVQTEETLCMKSLA